MNVVNICVSNIYYNNKTKVITTRDVGSAQAGWAVEWNCLLLSCFLNRRQHRISFNWSDDDNYVLMNKGNK